MAQGKDTKKEIPYDRFRKNLAEDVLAAVRDYFRDADWKLDEKTKPLDTCVVRMVNKGIILSVSVSEGKWWAQIEDNGSFGCECNPDSALRIVRAYYEKGRDDANERIAEATRDMIEAQDGLKQVDALLSGI